VLSPTGISRESLGQSGRKVFRQDGKQVLLIAAGDRVFAIANRCPHEGYPLSEGTFGPDCVLTCNWHNWKFDLASGAVNRLTKTTGSWGQPAVSPDGKTIAYVGYTKTDTNHVMELWTMSADGGNATLQSQGFDREPRGIKWAPDGGALYFTAEDRGSIHLYSWSRGKGIRQLTNAPEVLLSPTIGKGAIAAVRSARSSGTPTPV